MEPVLHIEDLRKSYRTGWRKPLRNALDGLNLEVPRGRTVGLLGPNGAGKTTTLKCIIGLVEQDSGSISIFGSVGVSAWDRAKIGFLPEQPYFDLYLTPRRLLGYYGGLAGLDPKTIAAKTSHLLNLVGLSEETELSMARFSKGMLQRVGLAQSLLTDPELLILDEPSAGLDPLGKLQVRDLLEGLKRSGTTILLSSHQLSEIEEICDDVAIIDKGRNVAAGPLQELLRSKDEYEIVLASQPARSGMILPGSATWVEGETNRIVLNQEDINKTLQALIKEGAGIGEVRQRRLTLEEFFISRVGEKKGWSS